jgi:hypothetical protein
VRLIAFLGAVLIAGGAVAAYREALPLLLPRDSPRDIFLNLLANDPPQGLSIPAHRLLLSDCMRTADSAYAYAQSDGPRQTVFGRCLGLASDIVHEIPTFSYAWVVGAFVAGEIEDFDTFDRYLLRSNAVSPHEDWARELRVLVREQRPSVLSPQSREADAEDRRLLGLPEAGS